MSGRYRICISDPEIIADMEGINPTHRGMLLEQAVMAYLRTEAGQDTLKVLKNRSSKANGKKEQSDAQVQQDPKPRNGEGTKALILKSAGAFH